MLILGMILINHRICGMKQVSLCIKNMTNVLNDHQAAWITPQHTKNHKNAMIHKKTKITIDKFCFFTMVCSIFIRLSIHDAVQLTEKLIFYVVSYNIMP